MTKIAILCDTHSGVRNSSDIFHDNAETFYKDVFFPYCRENSVSHILHLGDIFDSRRAISLKTANRFRQDFLVPLQESGMAMDLILGNHDIYYRNTSKINSPVEILSHRGYPIRIHQTPKVLDFDGVNIAMLPWINEENYDASMSFIETCEADILAGHLELAGFDYAKGVTATSGMSAKVFSRFDRVWSGHYHTPSSKGNIHYLGAPLQYFWSDANDRRFFHVFDTENRELTAVENPHTLFEKILYEPKMDIDSYDFAALAGKFVKILVPVCEDRDHLGKFVERVSESSVHDYQVLESFSDGDDSLFNPDSDYSIEDVEDTPVLLRNYINDLETSLDKGQIMKKMDELYRRAQIAEISE
jgi:DNA repair exonuclease SbcCD nuclease subunit